MKSNQLLDKLAGILSDERQAQTRKYKSLKKVLKALRNEKALLEDKLSQAQNPELQQEIESNLKVVSAQRTKGLQLLKELKEDKKKKKAT